METSCDTLLKGFGARCEGRSAVFAAPESRAARGPEGALGPHSPIHAALQACCDAPHASKRLRALGGSRAAPLAYDFDERTGVLKWLGPLYETAADADVISEAASASRSSRSSRSSDTSASSKRAEAAVRQRKQKTLAVANVLPGERRLRFSEEDPPRHWVLPFGTLVRARKQPNKGDFGVAFVVHQRADGAKEKLLKLGQFVGAQDGRYLFWTPSLSDPSHPPKLLHLTPESFAPALVGDGHEAPRVAWDYARRARQGLGPAKAPTKGGERPREVSERLKARLDSAARRCEPHMDAARLLRQFHATLRAEAGERRRALARVERGAAQPRELLEKHGGWSARNEKLRRQLAATEDQLRREDSNCAAALREALAQEEADRCRRTAADSYVGAENAALRATIEHGTEAEARRAIASLLAAYEDAAEHAGPEERRTVKRWAAELRRCAAKILAPEERAGQALPQALVARDAAEAKRGRGFSQIAEAQLLARCRQTKAFPLVRALLADKDLEARHDEAEWDEIKQALEQERSSVGGFLAAHRCSEGVDELLRATKLEACRATFSSALRSLGAGGHPTDDAATLGRLFALKLAVRGPGERARARRDPEVQACLSYLHLPEAAKEDAAQLLHELAAACLSLGDDKTELLLYRYQEADVGAEEEAALRALEMHVAPMRGPGAERCLRATKRLLRSLR